MLVGEKNRRHISPQIKILFHRENAPCLSKNYFKIAYNFKVYLSYLEPVHGSIKYSDPFQILLGPRLGTTSLNTILSINCLLGPRLETSALNTTQSVSFLSPNKPATLVVEIPCDIACHW